MYPGKWIKCPRCAYSDTSKHCTKCNGNGKIWRPTTGEGQDRRIGNRRAIRRRTMK